MAHVDKAHPFLRPASIKSRGAPPPGIPKKWRNPRSWASAMIASANVMNKSPLPCADCPRADGPLKMIASTPDPGKRKMHPLPCLLRRAMGCSMISTHRSPCSHVKVGEFLQSPSGRTRALPCAELLQRRWIPPSLFEPLLVIDRLTARAANAGRHVGLTRQGACRRLGI